MLAVRGAFIFLVVAPLIYGIYYPQPYLTQIGVAVSLKASGAKRLSCGIDVMAIAAGFAGRGSPEKRPAEK